MIRARAMQVAAALPAYRPNAQVATDYLAPDAMRAENRLAEEEERTGATPVQGRVASGGMCVGGEGAGGMGEIVLFAFFVLSLSWEVV